MESTPVTTIDPEIVKLGTAVKAILDYRSNAIQNIETDPNAVQNAAEIMSTGGKSRRFKITRRNQNKKSKKGTRSKK